MQDLTKSLILLNGELKTLQIASISKLGANAFRVSFKNNPKSYTYSADKVVWITNPKWIVPELCKVYRGGRLQTDVTEIWQFEAGQNHYWRIKFRSGYECNSNVPSLFLRCNSVVTPIGDRREI